MSMKHLNTSVDALLQSSLVQVPIKTEHIYENEKQSVAGWHEENVKAERNL